ncbi:hypothetical protein F52700_12138 [Fusarium sp. NRRL 52700]|nr:hypothetical protein F52700_12138 [Fusarium sp. NRRL 52700]
MDNTLLSSETQIRQADGGLLQGLDNRRPAKNPSLKQSSSKKSADVLTSTSSSSPSSLISGRPRRRPFPRKGHTKSRRGCFNCKRRRVKCPETTPACDNCDRLGLRCEYPQTLDKGLMHLFSPEPAQSLSQEQLSMVDLRFFHHFLLHAYPGLPIQGEKVWKEVAQYSHGFNFLAHAMLALGASHLGLCNGTDYNSDAISHRVKAIKSLNSALDTPCQTKEEGDARYATLMALTWQSSYMADGMQEFLSMLRGCTIVSKCSVFQFQDSVFRMFSVEGHVQRVHDINNGFDVGLSDYEASDAGIASIKAIAPLSQSTLEINLVASLQSIAEMSRTTCIGAFGSICRTYQFFGEASDSDFLAISDSDNHVAQIIMAHFFAIETYHGIAISEQWQAWETAHFFRVSYLWNCMTLATLGMLVGSGNDTIDRESEKKMDEKFNFGTVEKFDSLHVFRKVRDCAWTSCSDSMYGSCTSSLQGFKCGPVSPDNIAKFGRVMAKPYCQAASAGIDLDIAGQTIVTVYVIQLVLVLFLSLCFKLTTSWIGTFGRMSSSFQKDSIFRDTCQRWQITLSETRFAKAASSAMLDFQESQALFAATISITAIITFDGPHHGWYLSSSAGAAGNASSWRAPLLYSILRRLILDTHDCHKEKNSYDFFNITLACRFLAHIIASCLIIDWIVYFVKTRMTGDKIKYTQIVGDSRTIFSFAETKGAKLSLGVFWAAIEVLTVVMIFIGLREMIELLDMHSSDDDLSTWGFGQLVAVAIWFPVMIKFICLSTCKSHNNNGCHGCLLTFVIGPRSEVKQKTNTDRPQILEMASYSHNKADNTASGTT